MIVKDNQERREADKKAKEEAEAQADQKEADSKAQEAKAVEDQEQQEVTETYTTILSDIRDQVSLTNQLLAVQGVFIGIVIGLLFMKSIFDRIFK